MGSIMSIHENRDWITQGRDAWKIDKHRQDDIPFEERLAGLQEPLKHPVYAPFRGKC